MARPLCLFVNIKPCSSNHKHIQDLVFAVDNNQLISFDACMPSCLPSMAWLAAGSGLVNVVSWDDTKLIQSLILWHSQGFALRL